MSTTSYLKTLDGWRAIAILSVLACHSTAFLFEKQQVDSGNILFQIMSRGHLGVDLFFALSGFLICTRIIDDEQNEGFINFKRFYIRRFFRILPPYFTYLFVLALLSFSSLLNTDWSQLSWTSLFVQNYFIPHQSINWQLGHFWSLAIEEHFYVMFPSLLFVLGGPVSGNRNDKNVSKRIAYSRIFGLITFALIIAFWRSYEFRHQLLKEYLPNLGFSTRTDIRLDGLIWGAFGAVVFRQLNSVPIYEKFGLGICRQSQRLFEVAPVILILLLIFLQVAHPPFELLWQSIFFSALLVSTLLPTKSLISSFLELPVLKWIGRMSYSLYLWNNFFLIPTNGTVVANKIIGYEWLQTFPLNLPILFFVAWISFNWIEKPMIRLGNKLFSN